MIMTQSGRAVKRPVNTSQIVRAMQRARGLKAKAPAPWAGETWRLAEEPILDAPDDPTRFDDLTDDQAAELRGMEAAALADDVAWVLREYKVTPDGDHLRFQGHAPGDFARVSIPCEGETPFVLRSSLAYMSDAAFLGAAGQWATRQKGGAR